MRSGADLLIRSPLVSFNHRRQPRCGCRGRIPTNILVGGDISGSVPTNIRGDNVVEYELKTLKTLKTAGIKTFVNVG